MSKKKTVGAEMPPEALEFFRATGAVGGSAKVPKGMGTMSPEKKQKVLAAALKARRKNAKARKGASTSSKPATERS